MNRQQRRQAERDSQAKVTVQDEFDRALFAQTFSRHPLTLENLLKFALNNVDEARYNCKPPVAVMAMYHRVMASAIREMAAAYEVNRFGDPRIWMPYAETMRSLLNVFAAVCCRTVQEALTYGDRNRLLLGWAAGLGPEDSAVRTAVEAFVSLPEGTSPVAGLYVGGFTPSPPPAEEKDSGIQA